MTDITLREYLEKQIEWVDRHFASQIITIQEKTKDAKDQIDKRLEGMNEFRSTLKDQAARLATIDALQALKDQIDVRLKVLEMNKANLEGKAAIVSAIISVFVAGVVSIIIAAVFNYPR